MNWAILKTHRWRFLWLLVATLAEAWLLWRVAPTFPQTLTVLLLAEVSRAWHTWWQAFRKREVTE